MRTCEDVLTQVKDWAQSNDGLRAAILTSSRVKPDATIDELSDYDIELYVTDLQPFKYSDEWLEVFGPIMIRWPYIPRSTGDEQFITRLILFKNFVRIDFQITDAMEIPPDRYDDGYRVLIDKDNITSHLPPPTGQKYIIKMPTREAFETLVTEFWWDVPYVPKYLWRDELPFAKYMLDNIMRYEYLHRVIEWYIGSRHDWSANTGVQGKWFKKYLDADTWVELESTYTGAEKNENWHTFLRFIRLFRRLAMSVAHQLQYKYPVEVDDDVMRYCHYIWEKK